MQWPFLWLGVPDSLFRTQFGIWINIIIFGKWIQRKKQKLIEKQDKCCVLIFDRARCSSCVIKVIAGCICVNKLNQVAWGVVNYIYTVYSRESCRGQSLIWSLGSRYGQLWRLTARHLVGQRPQRPWMAKMYGSEDNTGCLTKDKELSLHYYLPITHLPIDHISIIDIHYAKHFLLWVWRNGYFSM